MSRRNVDQDEMSPFQINPHSTMGAEQSPLEANFLRQLSANHRFLYACALTIVGNPNDANDVIQEACVVLWQKYDEFDRSSNFRKWACTITFNVAKNFVRRRRRHGQTGLCDELLARVVQVRTAESELLELRREVLRDCLRKLPSADKSFLFDCYQESSSLVELSRQQGKTVAAIYSKLKRLRQILARCVHQRLGSGED